MDTPASITISCRDIVKDNQRWYAIRARHKKITIVLIEIENHSEQNITVDFSNISIQANEIYCTFLLRETLIQKLREFTYDMILYPLISFSWWECIIEISLFLFGYFYNRRLKKQFQPYYNESVNLDSKRQLQSYIAFFNQKKETFTITIPAVLGGSTTCTLTCNVTN